MRLNMVPAVLTALLVLGAVVLGGCVGGATEEGAQIIRDVTPAGAVEKINDGATEEGAQIVEDITPAQAMEKIDEEGSSPDFVVLDVRTPEEFADGHIENAENIDYYAADFQSQLKQLDRSNTYVIYCRSGMRSAGARDIMKDLGFEEVYNVLGGILDWKSQGLPTVR